MIERIRDVLAERRAWVVGAVALAVLATCSMRGGRLRGAARALPEPVQTPLDEPVDLAAPEGFRILGTDEYSVEALVLSRERYRFDGGAKLAPVDFLLGWGEASVEPNVTAIRWSQGERWGTWRYDDAGVLSVPVGEIVRSTANTHIVPAFDSDWVRGELLRVKRGDVVRLEGYLVRISGPGGWHWNSSRTRDDGGDGSCEVFYVTGCERRPN